VAAKRRYALIGASKRAVIPMQPPPPTATGATDEHVGPGETHEKNATTPAAPSHKNAVSALPVKTKPCMSATPARAPTAVHATVAVVVGSDPVTPTMPSAEGVVAYREP
jgi:hypothetical protein